MMSWFLLSNQTPTLRVHLCVLKGFLCACMWVCMWISLFLDVHMLPAESIKVSQWCWEVWMERGRRLVLLNNPAPTVWPWGPYVYYLMTLCPEWETDPLWVRLRRKEEQFQCILHSDLSAQHTALEVPPRPPSPLRTTKCLTRRLETSTICMCFEFVCSLRDRKREKQWKFLFPGTLSDPQNRKYF